MSKIRILGLFIFLVLVAFVVFFSSVWAQEPIPDPNFVPAQAMAVQASLGQCPEDLTEPYFSGSKRNLQPNEDVLKVEALYDEKLNTFCSRTWSAWPGTEDGAGTLHFFADYNIYDEHGVRKGGKTCEERAWNPAEQGPASCTISWQMPWGLNDEVFYLYLEKFGLQNPDGVGLPSSDNSWFFTTRPAKVFIPIIIKSKKTPTPTPSPTPKVTPTSTSVVKPCQMYAVFRLPSGEKISLEFLPGGNVHDDLLLSALGQTITVIYRDLETSEKKQLPNGDTTLTLNSQTWSYGRGPVIEFTGGTDLLGLNVYIFHAEFRDQLGNRCWIETKMKDPPQVLELAKIYEKQGFVSEEALSKARKAIWSRIPDQPMTPGELQKAFADAYTSIISNAAP